MCFIFQAMDALTPFPPCPSPELLQSDFVHTQQVNIINSNKPIALDPTELNIFSHFKLMQCEFMRSVFL